MAVATSLRRHGDTGAVAVREEPVCTASHPRLICQAPPKMIQDSEDLLEFQNHVFFGWTGFAGCWLPCFTQEGYQFGAA